MGSDIGEVFRAVEEAFHIRFTGNEEEYCRTVGQLHEAIWEQVHTREVKDHTAQHLFYKLRSAIIAEVKTTGTIKPSTELNTLFPVRNRRKHWKRISMNTGLRMPWLRLPLRVWLLILVISLGILVYCVYLGMTKSNMWLYGIGGVSSVLVYSIALWAVAPLRREFTDKTMRELTYSVVKLNPNIVQLTRHEVEVITNHIIADTAGVDYDGVSGDKSFIRDLGL
jgi:hypothetical protein